MNNNTFFTSDHGYSRVQQIQSVLGNNAVLLPIASGSKAPTLPAWHQTTLQQMSDPTHLARLNEGNIGVLLGTASGNLCSIDIDNDQDVDTFVGLNPKLATTLRTKGSRGANLWVRIDGDYPKLRKLETKEGTSWGEWRADGGQTVIDGLHPTGQPYTRLIDSPPVVLRFDEIVWPDSLVLPWAKTSYERLVEQFGQPYSEGKNGRVKLNQMFFVGRFADEHHIIFEADEEQFYVYNEGNGLWEQKSQHWLKAEFARDIKRAADDFVRPGIALDVTDQFTTSLQNMLKGQVEKRGVFKKQRGLLHVRNGVLDLNQTPPVLLPFCSDFFSRNQIPIAVNENAQCPRFEQDLLCPALDDDDISLFQRWCGSVLLGINDAQRLMILSGIGGIGKSTLAGIIENVIGKQNVAQLRTNHLADRFELAGFIGKTLLTGQDVSGNFLNTDGAHVIKALCGGDMVDAELKGAGRIQLEGTFNILIKSNSRLWLKLDGDVSAWRRRLLIIDFSRERTSKTIPDLANKLFREEGPGILNFMIEGAILLTKEIEQHGGYVLSKAQEARIEKLVSESDSVRSFVRQSVRVEAEEHITTEELVEGYIRFCEARGLNPCPHHSVERQLPEAMLQLHHVSKRNDISSQGGIRRGYSGVALKLEVVCQ
jgi:P4 family phage/plasmid primase-like protien